MLPSLQLQHAIVPIVQSTDDIELVSTCWMVLMYLRTDENPEDVGSMTCPHVNGSADRNHLWSYHHTVYVQCNM
jgi:hypothetical protein